MIKMGMLNYRVRGTEMSESDRATNHGAMMMTMMTRAMTTMVNKNRHG